MKNLIKMAAISLIAFSSISATTVKADETKTTNYEEKLPYMFKDPNWEKYQNGDSGLWPLPDAPPYSTGLFTMASNNAIDYKEDSNKFFEAAAKYKSSGNAEVYYQSNPSTAITTVASEGGKVKKSVGGDTVVEFNFPDTSVPAYNNTNSSHELVLDTSQGQWLVTNGIYSRNNSNLGIRRLQGDRGTAVNTTPLVANPWGYLSANSFIQPEDFLMGLAKSVYGVQQSRPVYMQTAPNRLAKKVTWYVVNPRNGNSCGPITWTYKTDSWTNKDVSYINPAHADTSPPACGTAKTIDRGEYIVHPEGYLNNVWYRYYQDQNSFVSANVYELYFLKLLQKGILSIDNSFANIKSIDDFSPDPENKSDNFSFARDYGNQFYREYRNYGRLVDSTSKYEYPAWSPELGALYSNPELTHKELGANLTDRNINITNSGGSNKHQRALGINYDIHGDSAVGVTSIRAGTDQRPLMAKDTVTLINALRLIEKAMRVEHGDMSTTEASIITQKYGAQYLDSLSDADYQTVSYLLAKGVLNFENYQEYSNLYSSLTQSFAYKLLYRVANEEARLKFTEVTLTDSFGIPADFFEFRQIIMRGNLASLTDTASITSDGELVKPNGDKLTLLSDINFKNRFEPLNAPPDSKIGKRYKIEAELDDVLKYLYRGMPLVNVDEVGKTGKPLQVNGNYDIYHNNKFKLDNRVNESLKQYVGIHKITLDKNIDRYVVTFYAFGDTYESALQFVKANLQTRVSNVTTQETEVGLISSGGSTFSSNSSSELSKSISTNNDITINKDYDLSAYSNSKASVVGNTLTSGATSTKMGEDKLTSTAYVEHLTNKTAKEEIGQGGFITLDSSQTKGSTTVVKDTSGKTVGRTNILTSEVSSKPVTRGIEDFTQTFTGYNISMMKSADYLIKPHTFTYTDDEGKKTSIKGDIVVSWNLDLPSEAEQASLVGLDVSPMINDGAKGSWIFTKPSNKALAEVWNYNVGLNNAILETLAENSLNIPSGYFSPQVDILIDSASARSIASDKTSSRDLTHKQIQEIENNFSKEISENLSSQWVKTYIGSVKLANHIVSKDNKAIKDYIDPKKSSVDMVHVVPTGLLNSVDVKENETVWSKLVFNQNAITKGDGHTYFDAHANRANLTSHTIFSTKNGDNFYGYHSPDEGEGATESLTLPYVKDSYNNIFKNVDDSTYTYNKKTKVLKESSETFKPNQTGKTVEYFDEEWIVADSLPYSLNVYSKKFIRGIMQNGKIVQSTSGEMDKPAILGVIHKLNVKTFGKDQEKGIKSSQFMKTQSFNFIPSADLVEVGTKFIGITNGVMTPYVYRSVLNADDPEKVSVKLEKTTLDEGEIVNVPQFVILSKATWSASGGKLYWSKKFLGADPELYTKGSLIQSMKEQLIVKNSKNLTKSQEVKTGTLNVGSAEGKIIDNQITFNVPYKSEMIVGGKLNESAVLDSFNMNADLTLTNEGETASATQYLENKTVGAYNPNYDLYHNTLVLIKGALKVVTGTQVTDYTPSTVVDSVSLTSTIMGDIKLLNYGVAASFNKYKIHQYQDVKPPAMVSPFTNGAPPVLNADGTIVPDTAVRHEGLPTALELFDSLKKDLAEIAAKNVWFLIVIIIVGTGMLLSVTTLLAHVFAHSPITNVLFTKLMDLTGIDFIAIMSIGNVSLEGENKWIRTAMTSFTLGVIPITVFGLFRIFGLV